VGRLEGKIAIVTGAAGGIGRASAELFLREGAQVMLVDRDEAQLKTACEQMGSSQVAYAAADVSSAADSMRYVSSTVSRFGAVDIVFANAGIEGAVAPLVDCDLDNFDRVFAVNVRGALLAIKYAAPEMVKRGGGSIMITSSVAGLVGSKGLVSYVTSKHAVVGLMRVAALELAPMRIRVNTIHPGPIENRMMRSLEEQLNPGHSADVKQGFEALVPLARYGTNEEIAKLALFLASADASYSTGAQFVADGGFVAQ